MDVLLAGDEVAGEILGVIYTDASTGFGVVDIDAEGPDGHPARGAGPLADLVEGQHVRLMGEWREHPTYGHTFEVDFYEQLAPQTVDGLESFLTSERFEGLPARAVTAVLATFGPAAGRVIEREPGRLCDEAGLARDVADELHDRWMAGQALATLMRLVAPAGLSTAVVRALHARLGTDASDVVRDDPYAVLAVDGCRFADADRLARHLGVEGEDPRRLVAGARAAVRRARRRDGHQHLTRPQCIEEAARILGVGGGLAEAGVTDALAAGDLAEDRLDGEVIVTTPAALATERRLAEDLARLLSAPSRLAHLSAELTPPDELTAGQATAVQRAFAAPVTALTGGPGTGKTRTIEEVVRVAEDADLNVALCAPTGRAAKRIEEMVGRPASTVHRLLEARPVEGGGFLFRYGRGERLPHDLVICDEVSMCDTRLMGSLAAAVDTGAHLLLVGDPDQLPSVGPGDVLHDLVDSEAVPTVELVEIHRQAAGSRIVRLAREINLGEVGPLAGADGDLFMAEEPRRRAIVPRVVEAVGNRVPDYFDVATDDIQVVAPIYRGPTGVDALNDALKAALNPDEGQPCVASFHIGDRVMQTRNDAELEVWNGDVGTVVDLSVREGTLRVGFPRGEVTYDRDKARHLVPAWAVTIHKAQGGEWPVVVLVADPAHRGMLWRNLVYTAVTRASRALIIVGQQAALEAAAGHDRPSNRQTGLAARLRVRADREFDQGA